MLLTCAPVSRKYRVMLNVYHELPNDSSLADDALPGLAWFATNYREIAPEVVAYVNAIADALVSAAASDEPEHFWHECASGALATVRDLTMPPGILDVIGAWQWRIRWLRRQLDVLGPNADDQAKLDLLNRATARRVVPNERRVLEWEQRRKAVWPQWLAAFAAIYAPWDREEWHQFKAHATRRLQAIETKAGLPDIRQLAA